MSRQAEIRLEHGAKYPYDHDSDDLPPPPTDWAEAAARGILADLCDRRGVKHELNDIDTDVRVELSASLADIIRTAHAQSIK